MKVPQPVLRNPPFDPFDHSHCFHPRPRWVLDLSPKLRIDLFEYLHQMWKYLVYSNVPAALLMVEQLNDFLARSVLGMQEDIDQEVKDYEQAEQTTEAVKKDLSILADDQAFKDELRKLFEKDQHDGDDPTQEN